MVSGAKPGMLTIYVILKSSTKVDEPFVSLRHCKSSHRLEMIDGN
jgi:hypothetical protein